MGKLYIVGIGPGDHQNMTFRADDALKKSSVIVGYRVYVELLRGIYPEKEFISTAMTEEQKRCEFALELAESMDNVSLVCSGDSGIYGLASLVYELRGENTLPQIEVVPGITAASSGAALLGAPLTHDFAVISLSDRLTDWELIKKRLICAADGDLSIVLYNPASKSRPHHLKNACEILLERLPHDRICGVAHNIGRDNESITIVSLKELMNEPVDMFSTVFIGNSSTKKLGGKMVTPRGYKKRESIL